MKTSLALSLVWIVACASAEPATTSPSSSPSASETSDSPASSAATPATQSSAVAGSSATGAPTGSPDTCLEIKGRFEKTLAAASGKCKVDADCGCFPPSVADGQLCGGVTDKDSAEKMKTIFREFRVAHCHGTGCAVGKCNAVCKAGACVAGGGSAPG